MNEMYLISKIIVLIHSQMIITRGFFNSDFINLIKRVPVSVSHRLDSKFCETEVLGITEFRFVY